MNFIKATLTSLTFAAAFVVTGAQATVTDTVNEVSNIKIDQSSPHKLTQDFTDQGFIAGLTRYTDGLLTVRLTDGAAGEGGFVTIGNQTQTFGDVENSTINTAGGTPVYITLDTASLADLNLDGKINVTVSSTQGNFYFASSSLAVNVPAVAAAAVPEPASLALLGLGVLGLGAARRRNRK